MTLIYPPNGDLTKLLKLARKKVPQSARLSAGGGMQKLKGQCPNAPCVNLSGASLTALALSAHGPFGPTRFARGLDNLTRTGCRGLVVVWLRWTVAQKKPRTVKRRERRKPGSLLFYIVAFLLFNNDNDNIHYWLTQTLKPPIFFSEFLPKFCVIFYPKKHIIAIFATKKGVIATKKSNHDNNKKQRIFLRSGWP